MTPIPVTNASPALRTTAPSGLAQWRRQQLAKLSSEPEVVDLVDNLPAKKPKLRSDPVLAREPQKEEFSSALLHALMAYGVNSLAALQAIIANYPPATPGSSSMAAPATLSLGAFIVSTGQDELFDSEDEAPQSWSMKR